MKSGQYFCSFNALLSFAFLLPVSCNTNNKAIKMKGSDTEVNLAVKLAEYYSETDKHFNIAISGGGSGLGITSLMNGQADIANSSRPLSEEEKLQFSAKGIELKTIVFAEDATAFVVHSSLPIDEITTENLNKILSGSVTNWRSIADIDLPVNIYGRQSSSGTYSFVKKKLKIEFTPSAKEMTGNAQILEALKTDRSGIGYVGAGYISHDTKVQQAVKVLKIKGPGDAPGISPIDEEAIRKKIYFFQRPLYQFVLAGSWDAVKPFIDFEKGPVGKKLIEASGYYIVD
ncbi:MAG: PstS family phosphate ABC transporter substrate-binding protein [Sphingobacteriales bacterium]|nr:MAG: PstS family phosphate ABC transporter substrate-binding protein [Sphingobacteriales bacterium]